MKTESRVCLWAAGCVMLLIGSQADAVEAGVVVAASDAQAAVMPFSDEPDTHSRSEQPLFPIWADKARASGRELPPPMGVMVLTNWMDSDWKFTSATVGISDNPGVELDAAQNATMDLQVKTNGVKGDLWVLPFLDVMVGFGTVDVDAQLGLRDIPLDLNTQGDAIVPMNFSGSYYSFGGVLAGAYQRFYAACDFNWLKTHLDGDASLSSDGFWTFTAAPKIGYNAGLSQVYVGARFISKNENFRGTVGLPNGNDMSFDVNVETKSWAGNFGIRTVMRQHWELLMESSIGQRYQITGGVGYRW
ncbi:MAG: hypothetical protein ACRERR_10575 [Moraxellaceae bacterium]